MKRTSWCALSRRGYSTRAVRCPTPCVAATRRLTTHPRAYFYSLDDRGNLFCEADSPLPPAAEARPLATATRPLSHAPSLNLIFRNLRPKHDDDDEQRRLYPFVSPCGRERNHLRCADAPVVFRDLELRDGCWELIYAGSLAQRFEPSKLRACPRSGRLYHELGGRLAGCDGLLRSALVQTFASALEEGADGRFRLKWEGREYVVPWLADRL